MRRVFTNTLGQRLSRPGLIVPGGIPAVISRTVKVASNEPTLRFVGRP